MPDEAPKPESSIFRFIIGFVVMALAGGGFIALFFIKVPPENKDAMMFALGSVFGWAASVVGSEYGATTTGRKVAEAAVRGLEQRTQDDASAALAGRTSATEEKPVPVETRTEAANEEEDAAPR